LSDARWASLKLLVESCRPWLGRLWVRLKEWRALTICPETTTAPSMGDLYSAATLDRRKLKTGIRPPKRRP